MTELNEDASAAPEVIGETRPMYWSIRRELWENRGILIGPVAVAGVFLFGFLLSMVSLQRRMLTALGQNAAAQRKAVEFPYDSAAGLILIATFVLAVFYCLDALYSERRDRSILFWKSLPLSDRTTVLSKIAIPLVVLPLYVFVIVVVTHVAMLMLNSAALLGNGQALLMLWTRLKFIQLWIAFFYALIAIALWHAPVYAWLLAVSAWSKRTPFLWAVLPIFAIYVFESIAFRTKYFAQFLGYRLTGWFGLAFVEQAKDAAPAEPLSGLTPGRFLLTPGLYLGLLFAAVCVIAAMRLRRNREPI